MTAELNGQPQFFKLDMSEAVSHQIKEVLEQATHLGFGAKARRALFQIVDRLRKDPLEVGELRNFHAHLNLLVHVAIDLPVVVHFDIHPDKKFVIIQQVFLASTNPEV